jgi:CheY-like chemotaxis protein
MNSPILLIVDDDPDICAMLRLAFSPLYDVTTETNGQRALDRIAQLRPEVLICDLVMPGLDGLALCERVKAQWPETLVVIMTATTRDTDLPDAFWRIGTPADGFITKPFDPQSLIAKVHDIKVRRVEKMRRSEKPAYGPLPPIAKDNEELNP